MRLDEMILKANLLPENEGKTYFCNGTDLEYSKEKGFTGIEPSDQIRKFTDIVLVNEWLEKSKRHLTVSEAEKELDCVIDTPDISKLFRPSNEPPSDYRTVFVIRKNLSSSRGYYSGDWNRYQGCGWEPTDDVTFWIDPADLIKLLPKE